MKKSLILLALVGICSFSTHAQGTPIVEVNGGYTFQRWYSPPVATPPDSLDFNGFNVGIGYNVTRWLAGVADITGTYNTQSATAQAPESKEHIYSYLFGPRIYPLGHHRLTPYFHALFGVASFHVETPAAVIQMQQIPAFSQTDNNFSWAVGGGLDFSLGRHFAIRLGQFDYQQTRALHSDAVASGVPPDNQNNFKYSAGIVFKFGEH